MSVKIKALGVITDNAINDMQVHIDSENKYFITLPLLNKDICPAMERRIKEAIADRQHNTIKETYPFIFMMVEDNPDKKLQTVGAVLDVKFTNKKKEIDVVCIMPKIPTEEAKNLINQVIPKAEKIKAVQMGG